MKVLRKLLIMLAIPLVAACASTPEGEAGPVVGNAEETILVVENQSTSDMRIYVVASGQEMRMGSVTGLRTERLRIPATVVGNGRELRFLANPLAGQETASSFEIYVTPGEEVRLVIPPTVR